MSSKTPDYNLRAKIEVIEANKYMSYINAKKNLELRTRRFTAPQMKTKKLETIDSYIEEIKTKLDSQNNNKDSRCEKVSVNIDGEHIEAAKIMDKLKHS